MSLLAGVVLQTLFVLLDLFLFTRVRGRGLSFVTIRRFRRGCLVITPLFGADGGDFVGELAFVSKFAAAELEIATQQRLSLFTAVRRGGRGAILSVSALVVAPPLSQ